LGRSACGCGQEHDDDGSVAYLHIIAPVSE
jgi:hypothetical protein